MPNARLMYGGRHQEYVYKMIAGLEMAKAAAGGREGTAGLDPVLDCWGHTVASDGLP